MFRLKATSKRAIKNVLRKLGVDVIRYTGTRHVPQVIRVQLDDSQISWPRRPVAFVLISTHHGVMIINRNDYITNNNGISVGGAGWGLLQSSAWNQAETELMLALLSNRRRFYADGVVAIDCGANYGVHTMEWSKHMIGWGRVIAVEAQERIYYALCGNIALNNCFNAKATLAAVGRHTGEISIPCPDYLKPGSFASLELRQTANNEPIGQPISYLEQDCVKVPQITIDQFALDRVDFVKIDVEGMEVDVLAGAEQTIRRHRPQLFIEALKSDFPRLTAIIERFGYDCFRFEENILAIHKDDKSATSINFTEGNLRIGSV